MPGYERAEVSAELKVVTSERAETAPRRQIETAKEAAGASGLANEAGPDTIMLSGGRSEVLEATVKVMEAALGAGADAVEARVEVEGDSDRFQ